MKFETLGNFLIKKSICSKRSLNNFIKSHNIVVNNIKINDKNFKIDSSLDTISVNENTLPKSNFIYLAMNKPCGYVCSTVSDKSPTIFSLIPEKYQNISLQCIGRLDKNTCGLIFFTNNGSFNTFLTSKDNNIQKTYYVILKDEVSLVEQKKYIDLCKNGLILPKEKKSTDCFVNNQILTFINSNSCYITITEGKFHQVRRTFLALNNEVTFLQRIKIGNYQLDDLQEGCVKIIKNIKKIF